MGGATDYQSFDKRYDGFLFSEIGEQKNGMSLSMASALIRLGLDPWLEARRLAALSAGEAVSAVIGLIQRMTDLAAPATELPKLAVGLVDLLRCGGPQPVPVVRVPGVPVWLFEPRWLAALVAIVLVVVASKLFLTG